MLPRRRTVSLAVLLAVLSAAIYSAAFPPLSLGALAWVALVPLLIAAASASVPTAAVLGLVWGITLALGVGWPLPGMIRNFTGASALSSWLVLLAVGLGLTGIYSAAFTAWVAWLVERGGASPLAIAAGWTACELARSRLLVGNPWALVAYSQLGATRLVQLADATGPYGIGFVVAAVNATLAGVLVPALAGRRPAVSRLAAAAVVAGALGYGEWRLADGTLGGGESLRVAVVQGAIERGLRSAPQESARNLDRYVELSRAAARSNPQIVFWPEFAVDFYLQESSVERDALLAVDRELSTDLILGGPHYVAGPPRVRYHNSVFLVSRGEVADRYDKLRLVPIAERNALGWLVRGRANAYEPGRAAYPLRAAGVRVGAFVCFESMYPELVRRFAIAGAEVLANLSNDDWFGAAAPARLALDMASLRAIENRRYLVRAATTGYSAIIDPFGRRVATTELGAPGVLSATIHPSRAATPYQRWGDLFAWLAVGWALGASAVRYGTYTTEARRETTRQRNERREP